MHFNVDTGTVANCTHEIYFIISFTDVPTIDVNFVTFWMTYKLMPNYHWIMIIDNF